jgi:hypothetical protein
MNYLIYIVKKKKKTYLIFVSPIVITILFNNPNVILVRIFIITITRDFLLLTDRTGFLMRVSVGTSRNVPETNLILETNFATNFLFSYLRRENNPGSVITGKTFITGITSNSESLYR